MTIRKTARRVTVGALALFALPAIAAAQSNQTAQDWHKKSDFEKGVDQLAAPAKGKTYADPNKQKALDDAMNADGASGTTTTKPVSKPASGDNTKSGTATQQ